MRYNLQLYPGLHIKIITLMQAAGYDIDPKGVCFGIASMAAQAGLIPENQGLKDFLDRLHRINIMYDAVVKQATQEVNEQAATTLPQKTSQGEFKRIVADVVNSGKDKAFFEGLCGNDYICDWDKKNVQLYKIEEYGSDQDPTDLAKHQENTQNQGKQTKPPELQVQEHSIARSAPTSRIFIDSLQALDVGNATNPGSKEIVKINCGSKYDLQAFFDGIALYQTSPIVKQILEIDQTPKTATKRVPAIFNIVAPSNSIKPNMVASSQSSSYNAAKSEKITTPQGSAEIYEQSDCCGLFDPKNLQDFLTKIEIELKNLDETKPPVAIRISNFKHATVILYFPKEKVYRFFDSNNLLDFEKSQPTLTNDNGINNIWDALKILNGDRRVENVPFLPLEFSMYSTDNPADFQVKSLSEIYNQSQHFSVEDPKSINPNVPELQDSLENLLRHAIITENISFIKLFLNQYPQYPDKPDFFKDQNFYSNNLHESLFALALKRQDKDLVEQLLYKYAFTYEYIINQILLEIQNNNSKVLELLLQKSQSLFKDKLFDLSKTAIISAVNKENLGICKLILDNAKTLLSEDKLLDLSKSAMTNAIYQGNLELFELSLNFFDKHQITDDLIKTWMITAASGGNIPVITKLLNENEKLLLPYLGSAIRYAATNGFGEMVNFVASKIKDKTRLNELEIATGFVQAAANGDVKTINTLLALAQKKKFTISQENEIVALRSALNATLQNALKVPLLRVIRTPLFDGYIETITNLAQNIFPEKTFEESIKEISKIFADFTPNGSGEILADSMSQDYERAQLLRQIILNKIFKFHNKQQQLVTRLSKTQQQLVSRLSETISETDPNTTHVKILYEKPYLNSIKAEISNISTAAEFTRKIISEESIVSNDDSLKTTKTIKGSGFVPRNNAAISNPESTYSNNAKPGDILYEPCKHNGTLKKLRESGFITYLINDLVKHNKDCLKIYDLFSQENESDSQKVKFANAVFDECQRIKVTANGKETHITPVFKEDLNKYLEELAKKLAQQQTTVLELAVNLELQQTAAELAAKLSSSATSTLDQQAYAAALVTQRQLQQQYDYSEKKLDKLQRSLDSLNALIKKIEEQKQQKANKANATTPTATTLSPIDGSDTRLPIARFKTTDTNTGTAGTTAPPQAKRRSSKSSGMGG